MFLHAEVSGIVAHETGMLAFMYTLNPWKWHVNTPSICQLPCVDLQLYLNNGKKLTYSHISVH